jgi:CheY-like chemotaxis protein
VTPASRPRTLIVDDTPLNLKLLSALLGAHGFPVTTATSAEEAEALLGSGGFGLLLLDVRLPGVDGLTLARQLRATAAYDALVIVAVTAHAMKADEAAALDAGCDGFVTKPIDTRRLVPMLVELVERGRVRR